MLPSWCQTVYRMVECNTMHPLPQPPSLSLFLSEDFTSTAFEKCATLRTRPPFWYDCTVHNSWIVAPLSHSASQWQFFSTSLQVESIFCPVRFKLSPFPSDPLFPETFHSFLCCVSSPFTVTSLSEAVYIPSSTSSSQKPSLVFCFDRLLNRPQFFVSLYSLRSFYCSHKTQSFKQESRQRDILSGEWIELNALSTSQPECHYIYKN
jgi:hypothetical protein